MHFLRFHINQKMLQQEHSKQAIHFHISIDNLNHRLATWGALWYGGWGGGAYPYIIP